MADWRYVEKLAWRKRAGLSRTSASGHGQSSAVAVRVLQCVHRVEMAQVRENLSVEAEVCRIQYPLFSG